MYVVEKKITGWIVLQYKIIITKYQNIAINSFSIKHEHVHDVVVKNAEKKTYSKIKVYCKQNRHFYRDFF
jgi:hypothetical protein